MNSTLLKTQTVQCGWLPNVLIRDLKHCQFKDTIAVHCIRISDFSNHLKQLSDVLSERESLKSINYLLEKDRTRFIVARGVLKLLLGNYLQKDPNDIRFYFESNLKPRVKQHGENSLHFNVSHSGDMVMIAIGNQSLGIDIEFMDEDLKYDRIYDKVFSKTEIEFIEKSHNKSEAFYLLWTRKEALLKGSGKGIDDSLTGIPALNGTYEVAEELTGSRNSWQVGSFGFESEYIASLAFQNGEATDPFMLYKTGTEILEPGDRG